MATVTASISLSSNDLSNNVLNLSKTKNLWKAGTEEGLDTIISATKTFTSVSTVDLVSVTGFTASAANKAYICNTGTSST